METMIIDVCRLIASSPACGWTKREVWRWEVTEPEPEADPERHIGSLMSQPDVVGIRVSEWEPHYEGVRLGRGNYATRDCGGSERVLVEIGRDWSIVGGQWSGRVGVGDWRPGPPRHSAELWYEHGRRVDAAQAERMAASDRRILERWGDKDAADIMGCDIDRVRRLREEIAQ